MDNPGFDRNAEIETSKENETVEIDTKDGKSEDDLLYGVESVPPWYMCLFLGFQVNVEHNIHNRHYYHSLIILQIANFLKQVV